jgi:hypothetical protein
LLKNINNIKSIKSEKKTFLYEKAGHKKLAKLTIVFNFASILRIFVRLACNFWQKNIRAKAVHKMLVK